MKEILGAVALSVLLLGAGPAATRPGNAAAKPEGATGTVEAAQVIEITARKYEFAPSEIRVKKGTRVQLKIRALDRTHGFRLGLRPEGAAESGPLGLRFDQEGSQDNWKVEKGQERLVEFVAERPGTYPFKCSVFCGLGHRGMKGAFVVEE
ncbi:MAG TPA: cupredoxin domain-containing protein [Candidatus Acidoferrales bacterium]|jgi:cytochrome c oxidase subunit 2|nr:cupredoxin domain-containing protein [Candidatus Acidoferrales bacterium]